MPDNVSIQGIEFEIIGTTGKATRGLSSLIKKLQELKAIAQEGLHLEGITKELSELANSVQLSSELALSLKRVAQVTAALSNAAGKTKTNLNGMNGALIKTNATLNKMTSVTANVGGGKEVGGVGGFLSSLKQGFQRLGEPVSHANKKLHELGRSIRRITMYRIVRAIIKEIGAALKEGISNLYQWSKAINESFSKVMDRWATGRLYLKNSLGAMFGQVLQRLIPILDVLIDKLVVAINWVNQFFAALSGESYYRKAKKVFSEFAESADTASKAMKGMLMGFDKLNNITTGGGGAGSSVPDFDDMFDKEKIDEAFGWVKVLKERIQSIGDSIAEFREKLGKELTAIKVVLDAGEFALGAILLFSGAKLLGLALMIDGARRFVQDVKLANVDFAGDIGKQISVIEGILGLGLLGVGAIIAFSGANIPLGIGLMISGAFLAGHSAISLSWNGLSDEVKEKITYIEDTVGTCLFALGAVLALSGVNIPLGIGLLLAGALMKYQAKSLGWNILSGKTKREISLVEVIVGGALLGVGAILALSGAALPLGIGMMAAGAALIGTAAYQNWDMLKKKIVNAFDRIKKWLITGGKLTLGIILLLTGIGAPIGLALIKSGIGDITGNKGLSEDWDWLKKKLMGAFGRITDWWNKNVAPWIQKAKDAWDSIFGKGDTTITINSNGKGGSTGKFATGGYPTTGQYFIARESGPELVGRIGNRTAVVNNDQIVASVSDGVYEGVYAAMMAAGRDSKGTVNVILQGDAKNLFRVVREEDKRYTQQNGHSAFAYSH